MVASCRDLSLACVRLCEILLQNSFGELPVWLGVDGGSCIHDHLTNDVLSRFIHGPASEHLVGERGTLQLEIAPSLDLKPALPSLTIFVESQRVDFQRRNCTTTSILVDQKIFQSWHIVLPVKTQAVAVNSKPTNTSCGFQLERVLLFDLPDERLPAARDVDHSKGLRLLELVVDNDYVLELKQVPQVSISNFGRCAVLDRLSQIERRLQVHIEELKKELGLLPKILLFVFV